jgi:hypothetical protein
VVTITAFLLCFSFLSKCCFFYIYHLWFISFSVVQLSNFIIMLLSVNNYVFLMKYRVI